MQFTLAAPIAAIEMQGCNSIFGKTRKLALKIFHNRQTAFSQPMMLSFCVTGTTEEPNEAETARLMNESTL